MTGQSITTHVMAFCVKYCGLPEILRLKFNWWCIFHVDYMHVYTYAPSRSVYNIQFLFHSPLVASPSVNPATKTYHLSKSLLVSHNVVCKMQPEWFEFCSALDHMRRVSGSALIRCLTFLHTQASLVLG